MNQGFAEAEPHEWLLFWGSDDWAANSSVLSSLLAALELSSSLGTIPDLLIGKGRYVVSGSSVLSRPTQFQPACTLSTHAYRRALWLGSTPPHQATLFGPGARRRLARYAPGFRLSADLDYFLRLSSHPDLRVQCLDLEIVHIGVGGISGQQNQRRLQEVSLAYHRAFGWSWWFPFVARYIRRLASLFRR